MIRLGAFSDEADDSLNGQIEALHRNGISYMEIRSVERKNVSLLSEREAAEIRRRLNEEGICVWSVGSPLGKCDVGISKREWIEQVKNICGIANALGSDNIRAFSFFHAYRQRDKVFEYLNIAADIATSFGVTLYHENEKEVYGDTCERVRELMGNLCRWNFVYDPANFLQVGESAEDSLKLASKCGYYHIKDVIAPTGELVPAGEGDGEIQKLLGLIDRDTVLTVEPHLAVFGSYAQIDNSEMKFKYRFHSKTQAFDAAVTALKTLLKKCGWQRTAKGYEKREIGG